MAAMILRRIGWMVVTLLVISFVAFAIIQLPPGDFLTSQITALEEAGETVSAEKAAAMRKQYNLDEPFMVQYGLWLNDLSPLGFKNLRKGQWGWPVFKAPDLGRGFEENRPVGQLIGETIALTVVLSLATLLFVWSVAIPIGIYSAARQYSPGDYFFTFLGMIGLAIPDFLLALVLMYVAYSQFGSMVGGLFSPQYLRADWSWGKVLDMLGHLWLPVLIVGTSGTAGLIRIMRGNLLDELRKQYVVTARAKGVGRLKLLLKYPVRVAINPLISTIGWLLPGIVSGTVITAVVLGLPTTGPLLLRALLNQDMYLAGSMVMLLSFLTVIGTLISDLLLLWADPRIRFERTRR
jgi:peptide/nickel transport system permease protein